MAHDAYYDLDRALFAPVTSVTATGALGSAVDVSDWKGQAAFLLTTNGITDTDSGATPTATVKLQTCSTDTGAFTDVSGATFTAISNANDTTQLIALELAKCSKYVKAYCTIATETNATAVVSLVGLFKKTGM